MTVCLYYNMALKDFQSRQISDSHVHISISGDDISHMGEKLPAPLAKRVKSRVEGCPPVVIDPLDAALPGDFLQQFGITLENAGLKNAQHFAGLVLKTLKHKGK